MESTSYVLSSRMVIFYLVTADWSFDISLCENLTNQSTNLQCLSTVHIVGFYERSAFLILVD